MTLDTDPLWLAVRQPHGADYDLSSLRSLSYAGSPFPVEMLKRCIRKLGNIFAQGYGATETAGAPISFLVAEDQDIDDEARLKSAGKPAIGSQVKICDEPFEQLPVGELGEICVKGPHIMMDYWNQPDLTKAALRDGWSRTGDVGYVDADGYVYLTDRKS
ncbi:MAG: AMP-binding protein, partial [Pseudodonghicola sp.]